MSTKFSNFHKIVKTQFGVGIKKFRSDNANDYFYQVLSPNFFKKVISMNPLILVLPNKMG